MFQFIVHWFKTQLYLEMWCTVEFNNCESQWATLEEARDYYRDLCKMSTLPVTLRDARGEVLYYRKEVTN